MLGLEGQWSPPGLRHQAQGKMHQHQNGHGCWEVNRVGPSMVAETEQGGELILRNQTFFSWKKEWHLTTMPFQYDTVQYLL